MAAKSASPRYDALRAMRELKYAKMKPVKAPKPKKKPSSATRSTSQTGPAT